MFGGWERQVLKYSGLLLHLPPQPWAWFGNRNGLDDLHRPQVGHWRWKVGHAPLSKSGGSSPAHKVPKGPIRLSKTSGNSCKRGRRHQDSACFMGDVPGGAGLGTG